MLYGKIQYGTLPYGALERGGIVTVFNPDVFQIGANLNEPVIFTEEITANLAIGVTLHQPTVTALNKSIVIKVNTVDISNQVVFDSLSVSNNLFSEPNNASFEIIKSSVKSYIPTANDEVEIIDTGVTIFKGLLIKISKSMNGFIENYQLEFKDWTEELANTLVAQTYTNQTVNQIITDIFSTLPAYDISNVNDTTVITQLVSDNIPITNAMDKLAEMTNKYWYVSPNKEIFFAAQNTILAPFSLTDTNGKYKFNSLTIDEDLTQIRNKVTIKGKGIAPVTVEDLTSQTAYGLKEYYERDEDITIIAEATQKANAILESFKDPIKQVTFRTLSEGLFAGQQITIQSTLRGINESLNIETVNFRSTFQNRFTYEVKATSQRLGRIEDLFAKVQETPDPTPTISDQGSLETVSFSAVDNDTIAWSSGTIYLADGTSYAISANAAQNLTADHVIYFDKAVSETTLQISTNFADGIGQGKIPLAYATKSAVATKGASIFPVGFGGRMAIDGGTHITSKSIITDNIAANAITANEIAANTITAGKIAANTITANEIATMQLSAISADLGTITAGIITGATIQTATTGDRTTLDSNNLRFYNGATQEGFMRPDATTNMVIGSAGSFYLTNLAGTPIMSLSAAGLLKIEAGSSGKFLFGGGPYLEDGGSSIIFGPTALSIRPATNGSGDCGTSSRKWNYIYAENNGIGDMVIFDKFCPICEKSLEINEDYVFHSYKLNPEIHDGIHAVPVHLECALEKNKNHSKIALTISTKSREYKEWRKVRYKKEYEEDEDLLARHSSLT